MDFQTLSRVIFLLLIVSLAVYFLSVNKNLQVNIEKFEQAQTAVQQKPTPIVPKRLAVSPGTKKDLLDYTEEERKAMIKDIYNKLYKRDPLDEETNFYLQYIKERNITPAQLEDVIATTAPILYKTIPQSVIDSKNVYGTEDEVILVYNEVLGRNPDSQELIMYSKKLNQDKSFSVDKLRQILISSIEYSHLSKMQSNTVGYNMLGGATERQINMALDEMYKSITGKDMDAETYGFMKKKYIEFQLNEGKMADFIKNFAAGAPYCNKEANATNEEVMRMIKATQAAKQGGASVGAASKAPVGAIAQESKGPTTSATSAASGAGGATGAAGGATGAAGGATGSATSASSNTLGALPPNKEFIDNLKNACLSTESDYVVDTQSVFDTINKNASCVFDKDMTPSKREVLLSKSVQDRNKEQMKYHCERNSTFTNPDSDYILRSDQSWAVPQPRQNVCAPASRCEVTSSTDQTSLIGTLLNDSEKTSIGSILPKTPPRW